MKGYNAILTIIMGNDASYHRCEVEMTARDAASGLMARKGDNMGKKSDGEKSRVVVRKEGRW